jgi:hypothetical protein
MRRTAIVALAVLTAAGCSGDGSLPTGEVYRTTDETLELAIRPDHQVELSDKNSRYLGTYSIEDDGRVRVVVEVLGSQQVLYFEQDRETGLISEEGKVLYSSEQAKAHVDHARAQAETMAALREAGTAMLSWYTDAVGAAAAGQNVNDWPAITTADVREVLVPNYLASLPTEDGWGHQLEYRLQIENLLAEHVMLVRSPGSDGKFDSDSYPIGAFDPDETTRDIVWADGYFMVWPEDQH